MSDFNLNARLQKDSHFIADLDLCQLRLIDNCDFPWVVLIPRVKQIVEITDLNEAQYAMLNNETRAITQTMQNTFSADKINIATIGNVVEQLHMHIIARYRNDKLFPKPVWGHEMTRYEEKNLLKTIELIKNAL
ncbi:HIT family protein [Rickettsiaceae bacterium]|nr:HIT family protein [Rickettsiaceae bacterium]